MVVVLQTSENNYGNGSNPLLSCLIGCVIFTVMTDTLEDNFNQIRKCKPGDHGYTMVFMWMVIWWNLFQYSYVFEHYSFFFLHTFRQSNLHVFHILRNLRFLTYDNFVVHINRGIAQITWYNEISLSLL